MTSGEDVSSPELPEPPEVSVVVPMLNEEESVLPLVRRVREALGPEMSWELIIVDDGSTDSTPEVARNLSREDPRIRLLRLSRNYGQSTAMQAGFDHVRGKIVVTMDGDLQNDPEDIPGLVAKLEEGFDLVAGYRLRRKDRFVTRKVPSWVANHIIRWVTGVAIRDNGCSLKAYRRDLLRHMRLYSDLHRFIPAMAAGMAGARIVEVPVRHHPRVAGESKYGLTRIFRVLADLLTIKMIRSFRDKPLSLFATLAGGAVVLGAFSTVAAVLAQATSRAHEAASLVFPGVALLWFSLAAFLLLLGLVGEVALREDRRSARRPHPLGRESEP